MGLIYPCQSGLQASAYEFDVGNRGAPDTFRTIWPNNLNTRAEAREILTTRDLSTLVVLLAA